MNFRTVTTAKDITLSGITVELERRDGAIRAITFRDSAGAMVVVRENGYSGVEIVVPAPPKLVARWRLRGSVGDVVVDETFTHEFEAIGRIGELGLKGIEPEKILVEE